MLDRGVMRSRYARRMHDAIAGADQSIAEIDALMPEEKFGRIAADRQHLLAAQRATLPPE